MVKWRNIFRLSKLSKLFLIFLKIILITSFVSLFLVNGQIWILLCFIIWGILSTLIWIHIGKYLLIKKKSKNDFIQISKISFVFTFFVITILLFQIIMIPVTYIRAEFNKEELNSIVNNIIIDCKTDEDKTIAILNWFDRYSGNIYNTWGSYNIGPIYFGEGNIFDIILCVRCNERKPPLWVLNSRCGACGEHVALFTEMANKAGLHVRTIICKGIDHVWNEVNINGSWIIVEPSNVIHQLNKSGYDISTESYEENHAKLTKNISYIFTEYRDGRIEDITSRYTNLTHINVSTIDVDNNPIPNVDISIISYNRFKDGVDTWRTLKTDKNGNYQLEIGGGDIKLEARKYNGMMLYGEDRCFFSDDAYYDVAIVLKRDWTKDTSFVILFILAILVVVTLLELAVYIYYKERKNH